MLTIRLQRCPGIETDMGRTDNKGVIGKARISVCVFNDKQGIVGDNEITKRDIARSFSDIESLAGLEPLAVGIDQGDEHDRHVKKGSSECGQLIKIWISV